MRIFRPPQRQWPRRVGSFRDSRLFLGNSNRVPRRQPGRQVGKISSPIRGLPPLLLVPEPLKIRRRVTSVRGNCPVRRSVCRAGRPLSRITGGGTRNPLLLTRLNPNKGRQYWLPVEISGAVVASSIKSNGGQCRPSPRQTAANRIHRACRKQSPTLRRRAIDEPENVFNERTGVPRLHTYLANVFHSHGHPAHRAISHIGVTIK
jgi:hypothetical protein